MTTYHMPNNTTRVFVDVTRADNEFRVLLNGREHLTVRTENDPLLGKTVELTKYITTGSNYLYLVGANWSGPAHYAYQVRTETQILISPDVKRGELGLYTLILEIRKP